MKNKISILILSIPVFIIVLIKVAVSCEVPKPGFDLTHDELIDNSANIYLVELSSQEIIRPQTEFLGEVKNFFEIVEIIKVATPENQITFITRSQEYIDNDFNSHTDLNFWENDIGRSETPCCICGPDHTFIKGDYYLIFPEFYGSEKSAEIIKTKDDLWYKYVKDRVGTKK